MLMFWQKCTSAIAVQKQRDSGDCSDLWIKGSERVFWIFTRRVSFQRIAPSDISSETKTTRLQDDLLRCVKFVFEIKHQMKDFDSEGCYRTPEEWNSYRRLARNLSSSHLHSPVSVSFCQNDEWKCLRIKINYNDKNVDQNLLKSKITSDILHISHTLHSKLVCKLCLSVIKVYFFVCELNSWMVLCIRVLSSISDTCAK